MNRIFIIKLEIEKKPSTMVKISVEMEFSLPEHKIDESGKKFEEVFKEAACMCMGKFIEEIDKQVMEDSKTTGREICRKYKRTLMMSFGEVEFLCREVKTLEGYSIPVLPHLGIPFRKRIVESSYGKVLDNCANTSFRNAQAGISNPVSLGGLHGMFQEVVGRERMLEENGLDFLNDVGYTAPPPQSDTAKVTDDGVWIRKRTLSGRGKGMKQEKRSFMEVQLTRVSFANPDELESSGNYWSCPDIYASLESSSDHIKRGKVFFDVQTGLGSCANVIHISDAKANGRFHCQEYNPNAKWQLDWYHLSKHVRVLGRISADLQREVWDLINVERFDEALSLLKTVCYEMKNLKNADFSCKNKFLSDLSRKNKDWLMKRLEELEDLMKYLSNNRNGIYGFRYFVGKIPVEYLPFGSGSIERVAGYLIAHRMKGNGKVWCAKYAPNMVYRLMKKYRETPDSELLILAELEANWWKELQSQPDRSSSRTKGSEGRKCKKLPVYGKESTKYSSVASTPILMSGRTSASCYNTLKSLQSDVMLIK
jgi:hypothetical protein